MLPAADALVFPSTFPEAFGMVAAEAAACGVLPIGADHSGMREVAASSPRSLPPSSATCSRSRSTTTPSRRSPIASTGGSRSRPRSGGGSDALPGRVRELWSWESVAQRVLAASEGRLEELPPVPE